MEQGAVRDLEQIQEHDDQSRTPKLMAAALVMMGAACVMFAALALGGRKTPPSAAAVDPLGDLVAKSKGAAAGPKATDLSSHDVTFPAILSDESSPTTALAAVRPGAGGTARQGASSPAASAAPAEKPPTVPVGPPPPADRLPVVAVPAQDVLEATPVVTRPRDPLTKAATDSARITTPAAATTAPGHEGGYQLQVSSFRAQNEADEFADQLRARGHKAYVLEAHVPGRGTWFRVRVGPFSTQHTAATYRASFEAKEHVVPFIVPPQHEAGHDAPKDTP